MSLRPATPKPDDEGGTELGKLFDGFLQKRRIDGAGNGMLQNRKVSNFRLSGRTGCESQHYNYSLFHFL